MFVDKSSSSKNSVHLNQIEIKNRNSVHAHKYDLVFISVVVLHLSYVTHTTTAVHGDSVRIFFINVLPEKRIRVKKTKKK